MLFKHADLNRVLNAQREAVWGASPKTEVISGLSPRGGAGKSEGGRANEPRGDEKITGQRKSETKTRCAAQCGMASGQ